MVHIYHGDGKGKTTAAMGLALRALGHGWRILVAQFLKDGTSGEIRMLAGLPGVTVLHGEPGVKFTFQMTPEELAAERALADARLARAAAALDAGADEAAHLVVLDEVLDELAAGTLSEAPLLELLRTHGETAEIVLTGRGPSPELIDLADYVTEMRCEKHPFERGEPARAGVEW